MVRNTQVAKCNHFDLNEISVNDENEIILKTKLVIQRLDFHRTLKLRFRQALQAQLEKAESEKSTMAAESGNKIKQALSLLDTARKVRVFNLQTDF